MSFLHKILLFMALISLLHAQIIELKPSWQLVGNNTVDAQPYNLLKTGCVDLIWEYDDGKWKYFTDLNISSELETIKGLQTKKGYWVKANKTCSLYIGIDNIIKDEINIAKNWNLNSVVYDINDMNLFKNSCIDILWKYTGSQWSAYSNDPQVLKQISENNISTISSLKSGEAYWSYSKEECNILKDSPYLGSSKVVNNPIVTTEENITTDGFTQDNLKEIELQLQTQATAMLQAIIMINSTVFLDPRKSSNELVQQRALKAKEFLEQLQEITTVNKQNIELIESRISARKLNRGLIDDVFNSTPIQTLKYFYDGVNNATFTAIDTMAQIAEQYTDQESVAQKLNFLEKSAVVIRDTSALSVQIMSFYATAGVSTAAVGALKVASLANKLSKLVKITTDVTATLSAVVSVAKSGSVLFLGEANSISKQINSSKINAFMTNINEATAIFSIGKIFKNGYKNASILDQVLVSSYLKQKELALVHDGNIEIGTMKFKVLDGKIDPKNTLEELLTSKDTTIKEEVTKERLLLEGEYIDPENNQTLTSKGANSPLIEAINGREKDKKKIVNEPDAKLAQDSVIEGLDIVLYSGCPGTIDEGNNLKVCEINMDGKKIRKVIGQTFDYGDYREYSVYKITDNSGESRYGTLETKEVDHYEDGSLLKEITFQLGAQVKVIDYYQNGNIRNIEHYQLLDFDTSTTFYRAKFKLIQREVYREDGSFSFKKNIQISTYRTIPSKYCFNI